MLRLLRLLRLIKIRNLIGRLQRNLFVESNKAMSLVAIVRLFASFVFVAHWGACIWFVLGGEAWDNGWNSANGIFEVDERTRYIVCLQVRAARRIRRAEQGRGVASAAAPTRPVQCAQASMDILLDGRGADPVTNEERIFTIVAGLVGASMVCVTPRCVPNPAHAEG